MEKIPNPTNQVIIDTFLQLKEPSRTAGANLRLDAGIYVPQDHPASLSCTSTASASTAGGVEAKAG